jgi:cysteinyl-tRNA synthetase
MKNKVYIYDSLTQKRKPLELKSNKCITMYACGITPYDFAHIGHGRCFIVYDVLVRIVRFLGYEIQYCRNITDIDDKIVAKSYNEFQNGLHCQEISQRYYKFFIQNLDALGCLRPNSEPRVTQYIDKIIDFILKLIKKGYAYESQGNVYYDVLKFDSYGQLSKRNLTEQCCGARVAINEEKKHPFDFALWKKEDQDPLWDSPWGKGRPGWHIECSVMAKENLDDTIDIHGGGMDLLFPHHENERAQTEGLTGKQFVSIWMHTAFVKINKEKMSKSLNNFITMNDFFEKFDPMVFRYYVLNNHYRSPLDFSWDDVEAFEKSYIKLINLFIDVPTPLVLTPEMKYYLLVEELIDFICNDVNAGAIIGLLFKNIDNIQSDKTLASACKYIVINILGLSLKPIKRKNNYNVNEDEIKFLIDERTEARKNKNFSKADEIRKKLEDMGVEIKDEKIK